MCGPILRKVRGNNLLKCIPLGFSESSPSLLLGESFQFDNIEWRIYEWKMNLNLRTLQSDFQLIVNRKQKLKHRKDTIRLLHPCERSHGAASLSE